MDIPTWDPRLVVSGNRMGADGRQSNIIVQPPNYSASRLTASIEAPKHVVTNSTIIKSPTLNAMLDSTTRLSASTLLPSSPPVIKVNN